MHVYARHLFQGIRHLIMLPGHMQESCSTPRLPSTLLQGQVLLWACPSAVTKDMSCCQDTRGLCVL